ncbi:PorP/SprF family type IX secretion system membrane protein [Winogradskyella ursingii]|uniref:PorP/SprF family type IX secretion system membrane protein n=1 Tax=Winogradskyella ursingii TaxID=2686079 RepID=UPI0015CBDE1E|nr:type IX secretion system membrane protein PorP/SprF [Winogradskyella ursingii]
MREVKTCFLIVFFLLVNKMYCQQDPQYTQYMYNMSVVNPAYAGSNDYISLGLLYRNQWTGFNGAPETGTFFGHAPIGSSLGFGVSAITDNIGPLTETNVYSDVSYTIKLENKHRLAFGIKLGVTFHNIGLTGLDIIDENDPFFSQNISEVTPNVGGGLFYYTDNYYIALSAPNLLAAVHLDNNGLRLGSETQHYFLTSGYVLDISENIKLKPSFLLKSAFEASTSFDANLNALFYEKFELGVSYRLEDSISGLVNFSITPSIKIGYAYDAVSSQIKAFAPASHEVFLLFNIDLPSRAAISPRFF